MAWAVNGPCDHFHVGAADIRRVEELSMKMPMAMFSLSDEQRARHAHWLLPDWVDADDNWDMVVQSWLVVHAGRVILIDPCIGNGRPLPGFPPFDMLDAPFIERFAATGVKPEDVDIVICTHLHSDHCGWNTMLRDGRYVPTFPNARYFMTQAEVDRWDPRRPGHRAVEANDGIFERSVLPVLEAGLADLIPADHAIMPGLAAHPAHGHTLGHIALNLMSDGEEAWFTGDCFHHPIELLEPEIDAGTCEDFAQTVVSRKRLIEAFVTSGALIVPAHFAAPHVGYLREDSGKRQFEPFGTGEAR